MPDLSVVIVNHNTAALLRECLAAVLERSRALDTEIIVVDNASTDGSAAMVRRAFPTVQLIAETRNGGFGVGNNIGVAAASAPVIMLLNSDAILLEDSGAGLAGYLAAHPDVACVGPRILLPDGSPQPRIFGHLPSLWRVAMQSLGGGVSRLALFEGTDGIERAVPEHQVGWLSGVCMAMRRADFLAVGGFDPRLFLYCEDLDLCWRLAPRGRIMHVNRFAVRHYGGASSPSAAAQSRNAVWQQRNFLTVIRGHSGPALAGAARVLLSVGLLLRIAAGLALLPRRGVRGNPLLRIAWLRLRDMAWRPSRKAG